MNLGIDSNEVPPKMVIWDQEYVQTIKIGSEIIRSEIYSIFSCPEAGLFRNYQAEKLFNTAGLLLFVLVVNSSKMKMCSLCLAYSFSTFSRSV